mmetsp:Transcript_13085/g.24590  ORF Transcript_13085/g.24590 Transcript_13085/m.24590 type:complete len:183 (+) Transcript_13085:184-732(+)|eukprot:CAMPEP_0176494336 /NCGR_PEP_ID=MMETSP0200_2-20121128/10037_1 /TAXON_ID=947934 /ORGANISM="Chaetoceros sp., Strain GSL56" /LENGTH=182 /DNA_ID=CAMNT_0017892077 /DNA_START=334 /DNA_END=882 /DNA_ORIENTATION=-
MEIDSCPKNENHHSRDVSCCENTNRPRTNVDTTNEDSCNSGFDNRVFDHSNVENPSDAQNFNLTSTGGTNHPSRPNAPCQPMFRGHPINLNGRARYSPTVTPVAKNSVQTPMYPTSNRQQEGITSAVSVYEDEDYLVKDPPHILPIGQQTVQSPVMDLQTVAAVAIPDASHIPKLLKSHNVG